MGPVGQPPVSPLPLPLLLLPLPEKVQQPDERGRRGSTLETRISGNNKLESTLFPPPSTCDKRSQDMQGALFEMNNHCTTSKDEKKCEKFMK